MELNVNIVIQIPGDLCLWKDVKIVNVLLLGHWNSLVMFLRASVNVKKDTLVKIVNIVLKAIMAIQIVKNVIATLEAQKIIIMDKL